MSKIRQCIVIVGCAALLVAGQALFLTKDSFFGLSPQGLVASVLRNYPLTIARESAKLTLLLTSLLTALLLLLPARRKRAWRVGFLVYVGLAACGLHSAAMLRYPAAYEWVLGLGFKRWIYAGARSIDPALVQFIIGIGLIPFIWHRLSVASGRLRVAFFACLLVIAGHLLLGEWQRRQPAAIPARPHILLIGIDSLRYDRSNDAARFPYLASLRQDPHTVTLQDHIVGVPRTLPSWVEILQGRYAASTGVRHMFPQLPLMRAPMQTMVRTLRDSGYRTAVISDYAGDIFPRLDAGFDHVAAPAMNLDTFVCQSLVESMLLIYPLLLTDSGRTLFPCLLEDPALAEPQFLTQQALEQFARPTHQPLFLTLFYSTAHFPYAAPWPWYGQYTDPAYDGPFYFQRLPRMAESSADLRAADIAQIRALYDGALTAIDRTLGQLFQELKRRQLWDNTLIVLTADHGEDLFEDGFLQGHGEHLWGENVIHVPLIFKLPASQMPSRPALAFTSRSIDIAPTLVSLVGGHFTTGDGIDLTPWILSEPTANPNLYAYSEAEIWYSKKGSGLFQKHRLQYPGIAHLLQVDPGHSREVILNRQFESLVVAAKHRSLIQGRYKLVYTPGAQVATFALFDRLTDPANKVDLATTLPDVLQHFKQTFRTLFERSESAFTLVDDYVVPL